MGVNEESREGFCQMRACTMSVIIFLIISIRVVLRAELVHTNKEPVCPRVELKQEPSTIYHVAI